MKNQGVFVYEAMNPARKEILVGVTALPIVEFIRGRKKNLPVEVSHWEPAEELSIRSLAEDMPTADAWQFVGIYVFCIERGDWRIIRQRPPSGD
jgi:hypothetical protein